MHQDIALVTALLAGIASFVSPCVLPLVPAYLSFMSGVSLSDMRELERRRENTRRVLMTSLAFVLGLSTVFIMLGASASALGQALSRWLPLLGRIGGVIVIVLGLHMTGLVKLPFLAYEKRFQAGGRAGLASAFVMGLAFAFGWTPCVGPILGGILVLATQEHVGRGSLLLAVYSAGMGIPFLLAGLFVNAFFGLFGRIKGHFHKIEIVSGAILIAIGLLLVLDKFQNLSRLFTNWFGGAEMG